MEYLPEIMRPCREMTARARQDGGALERRAGLGLGMHFHPMLMRENKLIRMGVGNTGSEASWRLNR